MNDLMYKYLEDIKNSIKNIEDDLGTKKDFTFYQ